MNTERKIARALLVGCPGAGKSTFARKLHDRLGLPLVYLDMIWHKPDGTNVTREEFDRRLDAELAREQWIIDGNYLRTLERRLLRADTVFFLDLPTDICLSGAASRIGKPREDLPWTEHKLDPEFADYIRRFAIDQRPQLLELLEARPRGCRLVTFRSHAEVDAFFRGEMTTSFDIERFVRAQDGGAYEQALTEIRAGRKRSHWIWFVFPQVRGLGRSPMAACYGIAGRAELDAYVNHPLLRARLLEISHALLALPGNDPVAVLGDIDALKVRSSMTLFELTGTDPVFGAVLEKYYAGSRDELTLRIVSESWG